MKKKKLTKKLTLNKEKVVTLNYDEMSKIKGASILVPCTESYSILAPCCAPTKNKIDDNWIKAKGPG